MEMEMDLRIIRLTMLKIPSFLEEIEAAKVKEDIQAFLKSSYILEVDPLPVLRKKFPGVWKLYDLEVKDPQFTDKEEHFGKCHLFIENLEGWIKYQRGWVVKYVQWPNFKSRYTPAQEESYAG